MALFRFSLQLQPGTTKISTLFRTMPLYSQARFRKSLNFIGDLYRMVKSFGLLNSELTLPTIGHFPLNLGPGSRLSVLITEHLFWQVKVNRILDTQMNLPSDPLFG